MLRSLLRKDWRDSKAHLLLLTKFLRGATAQAFAREDNWENALKETPQKAIKRFMDDGMLVAAELPETLAYKYKVTELKAMLRQRGLPVSGRKDHLISRLVEADPDGMKKAVADLPVLRCSDRGKEIASQYLALEKEEREAVEQEVLATLQKGMFREASEAKQVFSRGLGVDWKNRDPGPDVAMLTLIFASRPQILVRLDERKLRLLRLAAGMMHLWGTGSVKVWLTADFETGLAMDNDSAARMLLFFASHQENMRRYRELAEAGIELTVEISTVEDQRHCEACRKLSGKTYKLSEVPELPYAKCTSEMGCRCDLLVSMR